MSGPRPSRSGRLPIYPNATGSVPVEQIDIGTGNLNDVDLTTPPSDGDVLIWNDTTNRWEPGPMTGGGGSSPPAWVVDANAAPYSIVPDNSTDAAAGLEDAAADAVAAAISAGVHVAIVEYDEGAYALSRALQTSGDYYAQVRFPFVDPTDAKVILIFQPKWVRGQSYPMGAQAELMGGPAVFHSTLTGASYSGTHGWPSVFGGPDPEKASGFSNLQVHFRSTVFRQPTNPSLCNVNGQLLAQMVLEDVRADTEDATEATYTEPTHPTGVAWLLPVNNNNAMADYRGTVRVAGYYGGIAVSEHTHGADKVLAYQCKVGVNVQSVYYHGASLAHVSSEGCRVDLGHVDPSSGVTDLVASGGPTVAQINIGVFDIEDFTSGWASSSKVNVDDGNDVMVGRIGIIQITAGVGTEVPMSLVTDGAANLYLDDLTQLPAGGFSGDAVDVAIADAGAYFTSTDVEGALQELAADVAAIPPPSSGGSGDHEHIIDVFNGDASTTAFELTNEPIDPEAVYAFVGGSWTAVTISGAMNTTATFGSAPGSGTGNVVIQYPAIAA